MIMIATRGAFSLYLYCLVISPFTVRSEDGLGGRVPTGIEGFPECNLFAPPLPIDDTVITLNTIDETLPLGNPTDTCTGFGDPTILERGLWYTLEGTGGPLTVSTCNPMTNTDTQISIFSGSTCSDMSCVAGNDEGSGCDILGASEIAFESDMGTNYFVRVHGFLDSLGNFGLTVTEADVPSALEACLREYEDLDEFCFCEQGEEGPIEATATCVEPCIYCPDESPTGTCFTATFNEDYAQDDPDTLPAIVGGSEVFTTLEGDIVVTEFSDCTADLEFCAICEIFINGEQCNSCVDMGTQCENFLLGLDIDCSNIFPNVPVFYTCDAPPEVFAEPTLQVFVIDIFEAPCISSIPTFAPSPSLDTPSQTSAPTIVSLPRPPSTAKGKGKGRPPRDRPGKGGRMSSSYKGMRSKGGTYRDRRGKGANKSTSKMQMRSKGGTYRDRPGKGGKNGKSNKKGSSAKNKMKMKRKKGMKTTRNKHMMMKS